MQAADLLVTLAPGATPHGATPGASAKGKAQAGLGALAGTDAAEAVQGADAGNPFAAALAALIAVAGASVQAQSSTTATASETTGDEAGQVQTTAGGKATPFGQLIVAKAAAQLAGAGAHAADETAATPAAADATTTTATSTSATTTPATVATAAADLVAGQAETPVATPAPTAPALTLPAQAKAAEALAARLASVSPRSDRAASVADGPHLPAWAETPVTPAASTAPAAAAPTPAATPPAPQAPAADPAAAVAAAPPLAPTDPSAEPAILSLAGGQAAPTTSADPAPSPRATGKALGKAEARLKPAEAVDATPAATGVGKGLATAPGQTKKAQSDTAQGDAPPADIQAASSSAVTDKSVDPATLALADQTRAAAPGATHVDAGKFAAHTVAHLAEQIVSKVDGKATRFDVQLDPAGLGKVDVKIEIGRGGEINAALSFDNPVAAAEMRSRAGELRSALEQAGFDLSKGGLSFDFSGQNQGRQLWDQQAEPARPSWARPAFTDLSAVADPPGLANRRLIDAGGVDVTI